MIRQKIIHCNVPFPKKTQNWNLDNGIASTCVNKKKEMEDRDSLLKDYLAEEILEIKKYKKS
jgi:hypothetical protein